MKKIFIFISCLFFISCNLQNDVDTTEGLEKLQEEHPWLKDLIQKAETDETGNYTGFIWFEQYKGEFFFVTDMMLGSGGIAYWVFDSLGRHFAHNGVEICPACEFVGNKHFHTEDNELPMLFKLKKDIVVYSPPFFRDNYK